MFATLKNKIKSETGSDILATTQRFTNFNNNRIRSRLSSISEDGVDQISSLRSQCNDLTTKVSDLTSVLETLQEEKARNEKTNEILLEAVKVAQTQKELYCEEQEKIQNIQLKEIEKLRNLLSFREQEAVDRLALIRESQEQIDKLTLELERLKKLEPMVEDLQDDVERIRHSSQLDKNNLTTTLAAIEEENRHLKMRLCIVEQARIESLATLNGDEKLRVLTQERKLLQQHLEEAHLQLSDIKSSWSGQNLALETQVSRLSNQVAEETTEKRKALKAYDDIAQMVKTLEAESKSMTSIMEQKDNKIELLEEEIDDLNVALRECREGQQQQVLFERTRADTVEAENSKLEQQLIQTENRLTECIRNLNALQKQKAELQIQLNELLIKIELEKDEKLSALLRNAELSQSEEILKTKLHTEQNEHAELQEQHDKLMGDVKSKQQEVNDCNLTIEELRIALAENDCVTATLEIEELHKALNEKNKTIKILNQRLGDLKKTVQKELRSSNNQGLVVDKIIENGYLSNINKITSCNCGARASTAGVIVMDEVNFKYLKHVIVKFLTSREIEARHLIRAVATLLELSKEEESLLHDTLNWKMSWFGTKPEQGRGQHAFSIPPS